jgi:hypothetical protein
VELVDRKRAKEIAHIKSNQTFNDCIDNRGFPPGRIVAGKRLWTDAEVIDWAVKQPADKLPVRGRAKQLAERRSA